MDKLSLDLDDLEVDSLQTDPDQKEKQGTVQGNGATWQFTCDGHTCYASCYGTCLDCIGC